MIGGFADSEVARGCALMETLRPATLLFALLASPAAWADLSDSGPYGAGWKSVTVTRPNSTTFTARLFYPAITSGQNAVYDGSAAPYPAISFGHGFLQAVSQYQSTLQHLAAWGYFVIASDSEGSLFPNHQNFANDLRYCLTYLEQENQSAASMLFGQVNTARFGMSGHSMGGGCSILATSSDTRVKALANLAAANTTPSAIAVMPNVMVPVSLICGSNDTVVPVSSNGQLMYNAGGPARQLPVIAGGFHCGFTDASFIGCDSGTITRSAQLAITRRLLTAFFNLYLKSDQTEWAQVWGPSALSDPQVVMTFDPGITLAPASASGAGAAGEVVSRTFTLTNAGRQATSYSLLASGAHWSANVTPSATAVLNPGQTTTLDVAVAIPFGSPYTSDTVLISARADVDGGTRGLASLTNTKLRAGDLDGDGDVDQVDTDLFIAALLGTPQSPVHVTRSDLNGDGAADGNDIPAFVAALLMP